MVYSDHMPNIVAPEKISQFPLTLIKNMVSLATSGFGVVVALAWNQVIQKTVADYIDPYLGKGSGIASLLIYAVIMTVLAVMVTMQLTLIQKKLEDIAQKAALAKNRRKG